MRTLLCLAWGLGAIASPAMADIPKMGGEMNHVLVTLYQQQVFVTIERPEDTPHTLYNYHESYDGPASVLDRLGYNAQYGWLANGFISLPSDASMWIEAIGQTPGLRTYEQGTFDPIFGTAGSATRWIWDGTMVHNWYAAAVVGNYAASYSLFVGYTDTGEPYPGYTAGGVTLDWTYPRGGLDWVGGSFVEASSVSQIPAPATLWGAGFALLGSARRRRR